MKHYRSLETKCSLFYDSSCLLLSCRHMFLHHLTGYFDSSLIVYILGLIQA